MYQGGLLRRFIRDTSGVVKQVAVGSAAAVALAISLISGIEGRESRACRLGDALIECGAEKAIAIVARDLVADALR